MRHRRLLQLPLLPGFKETEVFPPPPEASTDEWFTPSKLWKPLNEEFRFTLDVAASPENAKCKKFFTLADDGSKQSWEGERVWCNPPYSDIAPWTHRARTLRFEVCVMLLPCWTDRVWWHESIEPYRPKGLVELRFIKGRVRFGYPGNPEAKGQHGGGFDPSVLVVWKPGG